MLGLIRGLNAGDNTTELAPTLPRFLLLRLPLMSLFRSRRSAAGVLPVMGEAATEGLANAEPGLIDDGVSSGPSFGVLRAERRGVCSADDDTDATCVLIWLRDGRRERVSAASGS